MPWRRSEVPDQRRRLRWIGNSRLGGNGWLELSLRVNEDYFVSSTTRVYCRCNSGHYFSGASCPYDGWSSRASKELLAAAARLDQEGKRLSIAELRMLGVSSATLSRTIIVSFGSEASVFEALAPGTYVVVGETKPPLKLGPGFK
jgi:hypothetical protein